MTHDLAEKHTLTRPKATIADEKINTTNQPVLRSYQISKTRHLSLVLAGFDQLWNPWGYGSITPREELDDDMLMNGCVTFCAT
ncbi:hypothetical protein ACTXT7_011300 [Hymenolepis weldensis]